MLFDTHCHLDLLPEPEEIAEHLAMARRAGVARFMLPGVSQCRWQGLLALADGNESLFFGLGVHPAFVDEYTQYDTALFEQWVSHPRVVAVGEIGLDRVLPHWDVQVRLFEHQLALAAAFELPVIVHHRKSHDQILRYLKPHPALSGVIHAFSGSEQQAAAYVEKGFMLGVGGTITYERARKTRDALAQMPLSSLVLETDAPDMPLAGFQGQVNTPARLPLVLDALVSIRAESREEIEAALWRNSLRLFNLSGL